ncbi:hypothetical protein T12_10413 [Trichinella patagoniensis]|uniref:Uncharacterized protein n=1 Tax=Trichinella patagoniensis TaxID=990121 RepID=A0A0V0Z0K3_9BILA|nr:hypothetical protein T12_10413 [Trichinella patagoniensis]
MVLIGHIAVAANFSLIAGERVVLGQEGDGPREMQEEVVLTLGHLLHIGSGSRVMGQLMVHHQQALVIQNVIVVVVVQLHGSAAIVPYILDRLRVGDRVVAFLQHVRYMVRV